MFGNSPSVCGLGAVHDRVLDRFDRRLLELGYGFERVAGEAQEVGPEALQGQPIGNPPGSHIVHRFVHSSSSLDRCSTSVAEAAGESILGGGGQAA